MLLAEGMDEAADILKRSTPRIDETGYDNWNGGTAIWTIYLLIEPAEYARLGTKREGLEEQISARLNPILEQYTSDWFGVKIAPRITQQEDWRSREGEVSVTARQNIFDGLRLDSVFWSGRLDEVEFLQRLYDLQKLRSFDNRFKDAAGDIWQHRVNNNDWDNDWVYSDSHFNLLHGPTELFLRFLCEMVHPVVRPDRNEALALVQQFNDQLRREGWHLVEEEKIAGRPLFVAMRFQGTSARSVSRARTVADALDAAWMQKEIERLEQSVERDPALAIGTAKELVESCCKSILAKRGVEVSKKADLPDLTKTLAKELRLVPEGISDEAKGAETVRLILRNLGSLTQYLAELRGLYGSGHGRDGQHRGLEPRHARLAVGAAVAFIDFVTETHTRRNEPT
ncbi:abortive infection family protein [Rhizobium lentis]|uniref:abortive infection family protein n=1 Tax=Rhizobium lentis TaxID=1138194 RepID=UPI001C83D69E|nr:abortive infection family protein [Rhizobium lentis]MBX5151293.1 abortive infection family protein [Rhizobium lentis]MBX5176457.1 abortive infection family protein [Rhizobium lentis]